MNGETRNGQPRKGEIIAVSAPSGTGKTTIIKTVLMDFPQLVFSISATTRKKREDEVHGKDYFFLTEDEFKEKILNNEFVEWESFFGNYYGTFKSFVNENINAGKHILLDVDVKGALSLKKIYTEAHLIFILPPGIEELRQRLKRRNTEDDESFKTRIKRAEMELSLKDHFDYLVINNELNKAIEDTKILIKKIITKEKN